MQTTRTKKNLAVILMMIFILSLSTIAFADINNGKLYKIVNKQSGEVLQLYTSKIPHKDINNEQYQKYANDGEITTNSRLDYVGQNFKFLVDGETHIIVNSLPVENNILSVSKNDNLTKTSKVAMTDLANKDNHIIYWRIEKKSDGYYTISNLKDSSKVLTQMGTYQVVFSEDKQNASQLWQIVEADQAEREAKAEVVETKAEVSEAKAIAPAPEMTEVAGGIEQWFNKIEGYVADSRGLDFDGAYGSQCVDLIYDYTYSVFHKGTAKHNYRQSVNGGNGGEIYYTASEKYYQKIPYSSGVRPQRGDICVYSKGYYGHSAIVDQVDDEGFTVITINGSRGHYVRRQRYNYYSGYYQSSSLVGFLRPRPSLVVR